MPNQRTYHGSLSRFGSRSPAFALLSLGFSLIHFVPGHVATAAIRWIALLSLAVAGVRKRNLTFWIFFAMLVGLEVGLDWPSFAAQLKILSDIFLRLIKVIVAPLILGTLITGVAGHGDVRKVGRIGWKSLLYFEVITTIAIVVGVASININARGRGHYATCNGRYHNCTAIHLTIEVGRLYPPHLSRKHR